MIFYWILYIFLSGIIGYFISRLFTNIYYKRFFFSISISLLITVWFVSPGRDEIVPALSILLLEFSILESHGLIRIIRPFEASFLLFLIVSLFLFKKSLKN